ncbi:MAG: hypothetical protein HY717_13335 [Planctomycetes bacterium]|nr:hypothetical protein [Planctomycetota bacterium]
MSPPFYFRWFPLCTLGLLALTALALLSELLWGAGEALAWRFFAGAAIAGGLGILGWWILSRSQALGGGEPARPGAPAWLGFPLASLGFLAMVPLLLLAAFPEVRASLDPHSRITARLTGGKLEILFPQPMAGKEVNLQFDDRPIPPAYFREHPEVFRWQDRRAEDKRLLLIEMPSVQERWSFTSPRRLGINAVPDEAQILDRNGLRVPQQWIDLPVP